MTRRGIDAACRRIRESDKPFHALAEAYGIEIRPHQTTRDYAASHRGQVSWGPTYNCDPFARIVFVEAEDGPNGWAPEDVFHELVHVILALPFHAPNGIDKVDEERLLMQVERTIAQRCLPQGLLDLVYDYQFQTIVAMTEEAERDVFNMPTLGSFDNLGHFPIWRRGWQIARTVGVITRDRYPWPTFAWPNWPAMGEAGWRHLTRKEEKNHSVGGAMTELSNIRTIVAFSGGADSTAMAYAMAEAGEKFALLHTPTGNELPEVAEHVRMVVEHLGAELVLPKAPTLDVLIEKQNALPNFRQRWCTRMIKIVPAIAWLVAHPGSTLCVGLRADEETREGLYGPTRPIATRCASEGGTGPMCLPTSPPAKWSCQSALTVPSVTTSD